jgi:benzaldehyde dehydrogenase (NAD)
MTSPTLLDHAQWREHLFNGGWSAASLAADVIEPATGLALTRTGRAVAADVATAAAAAHAAQPAWAALAPRERAAVFHRAAALLQQQFDELALFVTRETGGILPKGSTNTQAINTVLKELKDGGVLTALAKSQLTADPGNLPTIQLS